MYAIRSYYDPREALYPIGLLRTPYGEPDFRGEPRGPVRTGGDDGSRADDQPGPLDDALLDGLFETDIRVAGALGPEIPESRETGHERLTEMSGCPSHTEGKGLSQNLIVPRSP